MHHRAHDAAPAGPDLRGRVGAFAFFLDVDGSLLDIADAPDLVIVEPGLIEDLHRLYLAAGGAVALISGRALSDIDRLFAPLSLPAAGQHGAERRGVAGSIHSHTHCAAQFEALRRCICAWAARVPGLLVEDKGMSLAVHYRSAPRMADAVEHALRDFLQRTGHHYCLQSGKMVSEVKPMGHDKGSAIREFVAEAPFAERVPIFIGDDATDEHGFAAVNRLRGYSVKVGRGITLARWRMPNARAVRRWIRSLAEDTPPLGPVVDGALWPLPIR